LLYRIDQAIAHLDHSVSITWSDGMTANVDFAPLVASGSAFARLRETAYFVANMKVATDRLGIEWPGGIDFSADGLSARAVLR
jgi:hypothetical protein